MPDSLPHSPAPPPDGTVSNPAEPVGPPADTYPPDGFPFLAPPKAPDEIGRLGPYRVLGVLGQGGMGAVFRAEDPALRRHVALKVMLPQHAANPAAKARFLREARAQAAVAHDHVITIHQVGEDRGVPFLAMPLLRGMALSDALKSGIRPPVAEAVRVAREMAEGLAAAHAKGLIHRDIKPANVWLEGDRRRVKILDFGLARGTDGGDGADDPVTASGAIIGTPAYMSPEQANGYPLDARSDLFSLGTVLYELLTGRRAFRGATTPALLVAVAFETPPPPSSLNREVPPALDGIVGWLMAKDPAARPPSARTAADALRAAEADLGRTAVIPAGPAEPDPFSGLDAVAIDPTVQASRASHGDGSSGRPPRDRGGPPGLLLAVGLVGLLALAGAGFLVVKVMNTGGVATATREPPRDAKTVPTNTGKTVPPPDRAAATYVLSVGGVVRVNDQSQDVTAAEQLPADPFQLTEVNLAGNPKVTDGGLAVLQPLEAVRTLDLSKTGVTDGGLAVVKGWKALETVGLRDTGVRDAGLSHFAGAKNLSDVDLGNTRVTSDGLVVLKGHTQLTRLVLDGTAVTDAGLEPFRELKTLTVLSLKGSQATGAGLAGFAGCKHLTLVALQRTGATAGAVEAAAKALPWCRIEWDGGAVVPKDTDPNPDVPGTFTNTLGMKFVPVGKGTARLGGTAGQLQTIAVEIPQDFFLGKYEVTQAEWEAVTGVNPSCMQQGNAAVKDIPDADLKRFPVEGVSWNDCQLFIGRLNQREAGGGWVYRLPTEAEWEYACRDGPLSDVLGVRFDFYFAKPTNTLRPDQANFQNILRRTCKVGLYEPNRLGLYDMHGNIHEWCRDEAPAPPTDPPVPRTGGPGAVAGGATSLATAGRRAVARIRRRKSTTTSVYVWPAFQRPRRASDGSAEAEGQIRPVIGEVRQSYWTEVNRIPMGSARRSHRRPRC